MAEPLLLKAAIIAIAVFAASAFDHEIDGPAFTEASTHSSTTPPPLQQPPISSPQTASQPLHSSSSTTKDPFTAASFLGPILLNLGFQELAMAIHSLPSFPLTWTGPSTIFAPSDDSIQSCSSCSAPRLLQEHIIPGLFSLHYLRSLPFGTKIETMVPGRCATVTSAVNASQIFVGGVQITRPDIFNNGFVVIHGLDGFVSRLSPYSCNVERASAISFPPPPPPPGPSTEEAAQAQPVPAFSVTRLMLRDAMLRLRISGYSILALALRVKYAELVGLQNMTVFALDDMSIFHGGHIYVREVRFHIVPNRLLMAADLDRLPLSTVLPTLEPGEALVVTTAGTQATPAGAGESTTPLRINYVRIRFPDLVHNLRIVVHGLFMQFPHLNPTAEAFGGGGGENLRSGLQAAGEGVNVNVGRSCGTTFSEMDGGCGVAPMKEMKWTTEIEDHHGL